MVCSVASFVLEDDRENFLGERQGFEKELNVNAIDDGLLHQVTFLEVLSDFGCELLRFRAFDLESWSGECEVSLLQLLSPLELGINIFGVLTHDWAQDRADVFPVDIYRIQMRIRIWKCRCRPDRY